VSLDDNQPVREVQPRTLGANPRCTCASPDPFSDQVPAMKHPLHLGRVCGVRLADGTDCPCEGSVAAVDQ
jgi:hypothetical protein